MKQYAGGTLSYRHACWLQNPGYAQCRPADSMVCAACCAPGLVRRALCAFLWAGTAQATQPPAPTWLSSCTRHTRPPLLPPHLVQSAVHLHLRSHGVEHALDLELHPALVVEQLLEGQSQLPVGAAQRQRRLHAGQLQDLQGAAGGARLG